MTLTYREKEVLLESASDYTVGKAVYRALDKVDEDKKLNNVDKRSLVFLAKRADLSTLNKHHVSRANLIKHIRK